MKDGPIVYYAHPIDLVDARPAHINRRVREGRELLATQGFVVYDPATALEMRSGLVPHDGVERLNRAVLAQCDALVACYPESRSVGVAMEIEAARVLGLPTLVLTDVGDRSWSLGGIATIDKLDQWAVDDLRASVAIRAAQQIRGPVTAPLMVVKDDAEMPLPARSYPGDAGFDLTCAQQVVIPSGQFRDVPCGISIQLPPNTWGLIQGRSSTLRRHQLLVNPGVIDNGWRGPLFTGVQNLGPETFTVKPGMRLAQLIPLPVTAETMTPLWVRQLGTSARGTSGFGSTGE